MEIQQIRVRETNCYLVRSDDGTVLIDPGPPGGADRVTAALTVAEVHPGDIRLILITHGHLDHYGAAPEIKAWAGAPIAAYLSEPAFSQDRRNALPPAQTLQGSITRWFYLLFSPWVRFAPLQADLLLDEGTDLSLYGIQATTVLLPGHSPGSLGVFTAEQDLFVGDLFVNYTVPSQPIYLSDRRAWQRSLERARALQPRMVYVGHGEPFPGNRLARIYPARYQLRWWVR
mgnify:CR=1 FL=1